MCGCDDEDGALVSEALDARLWYLDDNANSAWLGAPPDWFYEVGWRAQALAGESRRAPKSGSWLVFADRGGLGACIAAARRAAGGETILVSRGEAWATNGEGFTLRAGEPDDYRRLLAAVGTPVAVLHLWSLDSVRTAARAGSEMGADEGDELSVGLALGAESALHLLHAIRGAGSVVRPRLWLMTCGAQAVLPGDRCEAPWNAALWGLGKSLSAENAELWGGLIDLAGGESPGDIAPQIIREVESATVEDKIAFRGVDRYVARLERRAPADNAAISRLVPTALISSLVASAALASPWRAGWRSRVRVTFCC